MYVTIDFSNISLIYSQTITIINSFYQVACILRWASILGNVKDTWRVHATNTKEHSRPIHNQCYQITITQTLNPSS